MIKRDRKRARSNDKYDKINRHDKTRQEKNKSNDKYDKINRQRQHVTVKEK